MRGLPQDLNQHEAAALESALPPRLQNPDADERNLAVRQSRGSRSYPRRVLASTIVQLFLLLQILLPYFRLFLRTAYEYNRTHRISERAIAASVGALEHITNRGANFIGGMIRSSNGYGIQVLTALSVWWIREVSNGIQDGVENCVELADRRKGGEMMVEKGASV